MKAPPRPVILSVSAPEPAEPPLPAAHLRGSRAIEHLSKSHASLIEPAYTDAHDDLWNAYITKGARRLSSKSSMPGASRGITRA